MKTREAIVTIFVAVALLGPAATAISEDAPRFLHAHPSRGMDGPYWVAASWAIGSDGLVRQDERMGDLAPKLSDSVKRQREAPEDGTVAPDALGCNERAASIRERMRLGRQSVFPPGDFRGWTAASDAVVLGTVTGLVPGFDHDTMPSTLVLLKDTEHLYPSHKYSHTPRYAVLPYARFVAGGKVFCAPHSTPTEYYPEVGDRMLIAADLPADRDSEALTVRGMSRVVSVENDGRLRTWGGSDFYPVTFAPDFPETLDEARSRAWEVWRSGFVDLADTVGFEEFTRLWRGLKASAAKAVRPGCFVTGVIPDSNGWTLSTVCPPSENETRELEAQGTVLRLS